jgi:small subunit ribosomal protein S1
VDAGIDMFLPHSHVDIKKVRNLKSLIGNVYEFKVIKLNQREKTGVISRRVLLEDEKRKKVGEVFDSIQVGDVVKGTVVSILDYGAFVDIGGVDGLVYKENISYGRINHPKEKIKNGDEIEAKILDIDKANGKIALGIKQLHTDPWENIDTKYPVGTKLVAKVLKTVEFGAFIELEPGIEGLLHISDLSWDEKPEAVEGYVAVGDELWVQVIELNKKDRKIKLGLKQLELRPEDKYIQTKQTGDIVEGVVKKILPSRVFVELDKNVEGVIKISDISYFRVESPKEFLKEKETVKVMILGTDLDRNYKIRLGLKQLSDTEWRDFFRKNNPGNVINVKIKKVNEFGISVEITKNIEGFVKLSEVGDKKISFEEAKEMFKTGDTKEALILNTYPDKKRIYLSFQAVEKEREREEIAKYGKSDNESVTTIGELFENAIDKK